MKRFTGTSAFLLTFAFAASLYGQSASPGVCYGTRSGSPYELLTIDLTSGAATAVAATGLPFSGLAVNSHGNLYATSNQINAKLYKIHATTAVATEVGPLLDASLNAYDFVDAIAFDENDVLYGISDDNGPGLLFTIDTLTATVVRIASPMSMPYAGAAFDPTTNVLFASSGGLYVPDQIVSIDHASAAVTTLGTTGVGGATPDIAFDAAGNLYGVKGGGGGGGGGGPAPHELIKIDKTDGSLIESVGPTGFTNISGFTCFNPGDGGGGDDITVVIDIRPAACPNELNTKSKGNVMVAVLGAADFDVSTIDVSSLSFEGLTPDAWWYEDVSRPPSGGESCDCNSDGPDGHADLVLRFQNQDVLDTIGEYGDGDSFSLVLEGELDDDTPLSGDDCVEIKVPGRSAKPDVFHPALSSEPVPVAFALEQNYPNPFNPTTSIGFSLPTETFVELSIYNAVGQRVATLVSQSMPAGRHTVQWDATTDLGQSLSSGLYIYRVSAGEFVQTQKMLLLE